MMILFVISKTKMSDDFANNMLMLAASRGRGDWEKYIQPGTVGICRAAPDGVHILVDPPLPKSPPEAEKG